MKPTVLLLETCSTPSTPPNLVQLREETQLCPHKGARDSTLIRGSLGHPGSCQLQDCLDVKAIEQPTPHHQERG